MSEKVIWDFLKSQGLNDYGVAGLMGNLYAESALRSNNLQNTYSKKLNLSDEEYTKKVDNGTYTNFVRDSAGYGLAQWTFWSRKQNLLNYAKENKSSIGDLNMQLNFLMKELTASYPKVLSTLKSAKTVREASDVVLLQFERPADQSTNVQIKRATYGQKYYDTYAAKEVKSVYTNSPLVNYTKISPNKTSPRNHKIDTITIHCVVGQCSVETLGNVFAPASRKASSNYGIGYDGRIGMYVEEKDRSWCTSSASNDNRAITIEVASDTSDPYAVTDAAYNALIKLVADICKRNDIKELKWKGDKNLIGQIDKQNMTVHRWFANKSCPGDYLYNRHGDIANKVNQLLGAPTTSTITPAQTATTFKEGQVIKLKAGATYYNGTAIPQWVLNSTLYYRGTNDNGIIFSTQKTGAITGIVKASAIQTTTAPSNTTSTTTNTAPKPTTKPATSSPALAMSLEDFDALMTAWLTDQATKSPNAWSADARNWCEKNGIINGDANGNKMYKKFLTREELAAIVYRLHGNK